MARLDAGTAFHFDRLEGSVATLLARRTIGSLRDSSFAPADQ
jgi:hypothetical protein